MRASLKETGASAGKMAGVENCLTHAAGQVTQAAPGVILTVFLLALSSGCSDTGTESDPTGPLTGTFSSSDDWEWKGSFDTGNDCNSRKNTVPQQGWHVLSIQGDNNRIWGNVPKMWIFFDGNLISYNVGRQAEARKQVWAQGGEAIEFKACAETRGKSASVNFKAQYDIDCCIVYDSIVSPVFR